MKKSLSLLALLPITFSSITAQAEMPDLEMRNHMAPSPDGQLRAYHGRGKGMMPSLFISSMDGKGERLLHGTANTISQEPRWSPNGKWIAFVTGTAYDRGSLQLAIIQANGEGYRTLTDQPDGMVKGPSWSPDSTRILYEIRDQKAGIATLHIVDLASGETTQLTTEEDGMLVQAEWSPDGKAVLVAEREAGAQGQSDLWILNLAHPDHRRRVTNTPEAGETMPVWHPSATYIAYSKPDPETGSHELFTFDFEKNAERRLTATPNKAEYFPVFSADGKTLYYETFEQINGGWRSDFAQLDFHTAGQP